MTVAGCHLSALHPSPAPVQPGVQHETGAETSVPLWRLAPLGATGWLGSGEGAGWVVGHWGCSSARTAGKASRH